MVCQVVLFIVLMENTCIFKIVVVHTIMKATDTDSLEWKFLMFPIAGEVITFLLERKKRAETGALMVNHLSPTKVATGLEELLLKHYSRDSASSEQMPQACPWDLLSTCASSYSQPLNSPLPSPWQHDKSSLRAWRKELMRALQGAIATLPGFPVGHRCSTTASGYSPSAHCRMLPPSPGISPTHLHGELWDLNFLQDFCW